MKLNNWRKSLAILGTAATLLAGTVALAAENVPPEVRRCYAGSPRVWEIKLVPLKPAKVRKEFAEKYPELVKFLRTYQDKVDHYKKDPDGAARIVAKHLDVPVETARSTLAGLEYLFDFARWPAPGTSPLPAMYAGLARLVAAGATRLAIPCNTAQLWFDDLAAYSAGPIVGRSAAGARRAAACWPAPKCRLRSRASLRAICRSALIPTAPWPAPASLYWQQARR